MFVYFICVLFFDLFMGFVVKKKIFCFFDRLLKKEDVLRVLLLLISL